MAGHQKNGYPIADSAQTNANATNRVVGVFSGDVVYNEPLRTKEEAMGDISKVASAQKRWAMLSLEQRTAHVLKGVQYFEDNMKEIAAGITKTTGKPIVLTEQEVLLGIGKMRKLCQMAPQALADELRTGDHGSGILYIVKRVPKGVIDIITPWNYPVFCALNGVIPALLAGNGVSLKLESTPTVGDAFEKAFGAFVDPASGASVAGVLLHLKVDVPTSNWLAVNCDDIAHRVFTGSVRGGRAVAALAGERAQNLDLKMPFINLSLELGGCDAVYVHHDAELESATKWIITVGRLHTMGQSCCGAKRAFIHPKLYDAFLEQASKIMAEKVVGDPMSPDTYIGPLFGGKTVCMSLFDMVIDAKQKGARVIVGNEDVTSQPDETLRGLIVKQINNGWFFVPTLLADATPDMKAMQEETFGPLLPVWKTPEVLDETLAAVADTKYGLTCAVYTQDDSVADDFIAAAKTSTVFVNWCNDVHPQLVWAGLQHSGNGNGAMGFEGFRVLTNTKSVLRAAHGMKI